MNKRKQIATIGLFLSICIGFLPSILNLLNFDFSVFPTHSTPGTSEWIPYYLLLVLAALSFALSIKNVFHTKAHTSNLIFLIMAGAGF